jgi:HAD superfamily hydrolase (TIGR01490 family)
METTISGDKQGYTVFFDLDHTIISKISGKSLAVSAVRKGYVRSGDLLRISYTWLLYKMKLIDPQTMSEKMIGWTKGIPEVKINELCNETTDNQLLPYVYNEAIEEIGAHRRNNARVVLLSASIDQVCRKIALKIGADDIICTSLQSKDGYLTGHADGKVCFGEEKITRLRDYCLRNNIDISESWYYGDSISDLPVLRKVGSPVCINPSGKLLKTAREEGWKILNWSV